MLSGNPPWISRFPDAAILNYIIWSKPPPLDDLPADVKESVRDLIACCLVKDKAIRPTAEQILSHAAFKLLDQAGSLFSIAQHATVAYCTATPSAAASVSASLPMQAPPQSLQAAPQSLQSAPQPLQAPPQPLQAPPEPLQASAQQSLQAPPQSLQAPSQQSLQAPSQQSLQAPPQSSQAAPQSLQAPPQQSLQAAPHSLQAATQTLQASPQSSQAPPQSLKGAWSVPKLPVGSQGSQEVPVQSQAASHHTQESAHQQEQASHQPGKTYYLQEQTTYKEMQPFLRQEQAYYPPQQVSHHPQTEAAGGILAREAGSSLITDPSQLESSAVARLCPFTAHQPVVRVVEIPRRSSTTAAAGLQSRDHSGPQSLPGSLGASSNSSLVHNQPTSPSQGHMTLHRKSDPVISTPFTAQEGQSSTQPEPSAQMKVGRAEMTSEEGPGAVDQNIEQTTAERTRQQRDQQGPGPSLEGGRSPLNEPGLTLPQQERQGRARAGGLALDTRENWLPFQPVLWPDLPSPIITMASQATALPPDRSLQSLATMTSPSGADSGSHLGATTSQSFFPSVQQTVPRVIRSVLSVPAPARVSQSEDGDNSAVQQENDQAPLSSYGTAMSSLELENVGQSSALPPLATPEPVPVQGQKYCGDTSSTHAIVQQSSVPLTRVALNKSPGSPLHLVTVLPQGPCHSTEAQQRQELGQPGSDRSSVLLTNAICRPLSSSQVMASPAVPPVDHTSSSGTLVGPDAQQVVMRQPGHQPDIPDQYPVLPALLPEDFHVSDRHRGIARLSHLLSMIPEGLEQESIAPSTQGGSSMESAEGTVWDYIQDQFTQPTNTPDQLLQSFHDQCDNRPRLELYAPPPAATEGDVKDETCGQQMPAMLPRFELLQSSLSDSSTLRSTRITPLEDFSMQSQCLPDHQGSSASHQMNGHAGAPQDEPDYTFTMVQMSSGSRQSVGQIQNELTNTPTAPAYCDEEQISSGDMFGSGSNKNPAFEEAYQYRQQQHQQSPLESPLHQPPPAEPTLSGAAVSKSMSKKPKLRLNVEKPVLFPTKATSGHRDAQGAVGESSASAHGDDAFLFHTGVSPMTASPLLSTTPSSSTPRHAEVRPRSRNESGSSVSTPKSSTYDRQEQEWNTLQQETPGLEDALLEDPMAASGSELSSTHHLSLLYESQGESNTSDQEENEMLSMLQEGISDNQLGGQLLVFEDAAGVSLFSMRVLKKDKGWRELALTFRSEIHNTGYLHFTLVQEDGRTPVDYFSPFDTTITRVKVIEVMEEQEDIISVCWCDHHLVY